MNQSSEKDGSPGGVKRYSLRASALQVDAIHGSWVRYDDYVAVQEDRLAQRLEIQYLQARLELASRAWHPIYDALQAWREASLVEHATDPNGPALETKRALNALLRVVERNGDELNDVLYRTYPR